MEIIKKISFNPEKYGEYSVIKQLYKTKNGELYLVLKNIKDDKLYILHKIEIKTEKTKKIIENEIKILKQINSKYIMPIVDEYFSVGMIETNPNIGVSEQISQKEKELLLQKSKAGAIPYNEQSNDESESYINVNFITAQGTTYNIAVNKEATIEEALKKYLNIIGRPDLINDITDKIFFMYNDKKLKFEDNTPISKLFDKNPIVNVFGIEEKEFCCLIFDYYESNLFKLIYESNFLNSKNIWKFFIQIIIALNSLKLNNLLPNNLFPENIYIDKDNNVKIGGIGISLDIINKNKSEIDKLSYNSPEIIKGEQNDEKNILWSVGCIFYELAFKKRAFMEKNYKTLEHNILQFKYDLPFNCEKDISLIIPKLLCEKKRRVSIKELILDGLFKNKIIEINLFPYILKTNLQGK